MSCLQVLHAETVKFGTVRSHLWAIAVSVAAMTAYTLALAPGAVRAVVDHSPQLAEGVTAANLGLDDLHLWAVVPVLVGSLIGAAEYVAGQLNTSLLAAPHRRQVMAAKLLLAGGLCAVLAIAEAALVAAAYQGRLGVESVFANGGEGEYLIRSALAVLYWVCLGLMAASVSALVRSQAITLTVLIVATFAGMVLMLISNVFQFLPTVAAVVMFNPEQTMGFGHQPTLDREGAIAVVISWTAVLGALGTASFVRRDVGGSTARLG